MAPTFAIRPNMFKREQQVTLEADGLTVSGSGAALHMRYDDVTFVRLSSVPSQVGVHRECRIKARDGKVVRIPALYYQGLGKVDDRTDRYAPFVRDLLGRIASANPAVKYQANSRMMWWIFALLLGLLTAVVGLLLIVTIVEPQVIIKTSGPMLVLAFVGPMMWRYLKKPPGTFDPRLPPAELLGA